MMSPVPATIEDIGIITLLCTPEGINWKTEEAVGKGTTLLQRTIGHHLLIIKEPHLLLVDHQQVAAVVVDV